MTASTGPPTTHRAGLRHRLPRWVAPVVVGAGALLVCVTLALIDPETRARFSPGCPFRAVTGLDCPGCGGTRALHALVQGDPVRALDHNLLTVALFLPLLSWAWWRWLAVSVGWRSTGPDVSTRFAWTVAGLVVGFWVLRNVPVWPLTWLGSAAT